jgi:PAS domain S-box-containing protein
MKTLILSNHHTRTYTILAAAALVIIASFVLFYLGYREQIEVNKKIYQEEAQKERLYLIQSTINRAGIDMRDYLITGQQSSMKKSLAEMARVDSLVAVLSRPSSKEPTYQKLKFLLVEANDRLIRIDTSYKKYGRDVAATILLEDGFRLFRQDINTILQELKQDSSEHFDYLLSTVRQIRNRNIIGFLVLFVVSFLILLMLWLYFRTTEKRLAKKRAHLQETVERQEQSEQLLLGGYFEWHPEKKQLIWSHGMFTLFEWPTEQTAPNLDWVLERVIDSLDREIIRQWMQEAGSANRLSRQVRIQTANGKEKILQIEGYPSKYSGKDHMIRRGVLQDITQRALAERENTQLAGIIENSLNEIYIFDEKTFLFDYVNKGALQNIGYYQEEMQQMTPLDIKPAYDLERFNELVFPLRSGKEDLILFNTVHRRKDGSIYHVEVHLQLMKFRNKKVFTAIIIDVSAAVESARQLKEINEHLQQRNQELNQFASVTAHDLQEPLRMVKSFTELLETKYGPQLDSKGQEYLHYAADGARRMQVLINDILEYSRAGGKNYEMQAVSMKELIATILRDLRIRIETSGASMQVTDLSGILVWGNESWLYRLFLNLISNGLKFHKPGVAPLLEISSTETAGGYQFCIRDNGIGISPAYLDQIFQPYQRLHNRDQYEGTGLGLAICKKIAERHQGSIRVESVEGEGSRFYIELTKHPE